MSGVALDIEVLARGADDISLVERAYREVLGPSFTSDELPPFDILRPMLEVATVVVAFEEGELVCVAVVEHEENELIALLSYLAVRPGRRNGGIGKALMDRLRALWREQGIPVVLGEVHDPRRWDAMPDELPVARLRFYERQGARVLAAPWVQPRLWPGGERVPGMLLLVIYAEQDLESVPASRVATWMADYYAECEGPSASTDATLRELLDRVHAVDPVPVLAVSALESIPSFDC